MSSIYFYEFSAEEPVGRVNIQTTSENEILHNKTSNKRFIIQLSSQ